MEFDMNKLMMKSDFSLEPNTFTISKNDDWLLKIDKDNILHINKDIVKPADELAKEIIDLLERYILDIKKNK